MFCFRFYCCDGPCARRRGSGEGSDLARPRVSHLPVPEMLSRIVLMSSCEWTVEPSMISALLREERGSLSVT